MSLLLALQAGTGYTLTCEGGVYSLEGQNAVITHVEANNYAISCDAGIYSISGQQATINRATASTSGSGVVKRKPGKYEVYSFNKPVEPIKVANDDEYVLLFLM
jgi:hypothetical protein